MLVCASLAEAQGELPQGYEPTPQPSVAFPPPEGSERSQRIEEAIEELAKYDKAAAKALKKKFEAGQILTISTLIAGPVAGAVPDGRPAGGGGGPPAWIPDPGNWMYLNEWYLKGDGIVPPPFTGDDVIMANDDTELSAKVKKSLLATVLLHEFVHCGQASDGSLCSRAKNELEAYCRQIDVVDQMINQYQADGCPQADIDRLKEWRAWLLEAKASYTIIRLIACLF